MATKSFIHIDIKAKTYLVESWNSRLRYYIPTLVRRTKCYFKSEKSIEMTVNLFFYYQDKH